MSKKYRYDNYRYCWIVIQDGDFCLMDDSSENGIMEWVDKDNLIEES